jgi:hypothetical protein
MDALNPVGEVGGRFFHVEAGVVDAFREAVEGERAVAHMGEEGGGDAVVVADHDAFGYGGGRAGGEDEAGGVGDGNAGHGLNGPFIYCRAILETCYLSLYTLTRKKVVAGPLIHW